MTVETWKSIPGAPHYEVSDAGRFRRLYYSGRSKHPFKLLKLTPNNKGYIPITFCVNGKARAFFSHRIVCSVFNGPCPAQHECAHDNGIRADNRAINLLWKTKLENARDMIRHGTVLRGQKNHQALLTSDIVIKLRRRVLAGEKRIELAAEFGVSYPTIVKAVNGGNWGWL